MKCSVYIATSADGYLAKPNGAIGWLHTTGNLEADLGSEDMGWHSFIELGLFNEMILTQVPMLLGDGIPLFGKANCQVKLEKPVVSAFPNDYIQVKYTVSSL
jgi:dihydrofolate reductase